MYDIDIFEQIQPSTKKVKSLGLSPRFSKHLRLWLHPSALTNATLFSEQHQTPGSE